MAALLSDESVVARQFGGAGAISGSVTDATGTPAQRIVRLYDRASGKLIRSVLSGADGAFAFSDLHVGLMVDVRVMDDKAGAVYNDLVHSGVVVA